MSPAPAAGPSPVRHVRGIAPLLVLLCVLALLHPGRSRADSDGECVRVTGTTHAPRFRVMPRAEGASLTAALRERGIEALPKPAAPSAAATLPETNSLNPTFLQLGSPNGIAGFGYSACAVGDVNNDGFADFAVTTKNPGANGYAAYLYFGGPSGPPGTPAWSKENFAHPMKVTAAGDVNGDGYDDVLFHYGYVGNPGQGAVEVHYGGPTGLHDAADFSYPNINGWGVSAATAGDVNGDGYDDIVVGSPSAGGAVVFRGSSTGLHPLDLIVLAGPADPSPKYGVAVAGVGDVNGDGFDDVAVGDPDCPYPAGAGTVCVYEQLAVGNPNATQTFGSTLGGDVDFGSTLGPAGDFNGDGFADIVVGDSLWNSGTVVRVGEAQVFRGGAGGIGAALTLWIGGGQDAMLGNQVWTAGDLNGDGFADVVMTMAGASLVTILSGKQAGAGENAVLASGTWGTLTAHAAGDVNGDGFGELLVGSPEVSTAGVVRLYYGQSDPLATAPIRTFYGGQAGALAGWSIAMGDVNGDGYDDLVVGLPHWAANGGAGVDDGAIALYLGGPNGLPLSPSFFAEGADPGGQLGLSVAAGGDFNGDGYGDLFVGAPTALGQGIAYLWFGLQDWTGNTPTWEFPGGQPNGGYGQCVAFGGDVNGDGFADLLIGSPNYNQTSPTSVTQSGRSRLFLGDASAPVPTGWKPTTDQANAQEGLWVASAGDVNRDGYSDIVIGTGYFDDLSTIPTHADAGHARLYLGGPSGPSNTATMEWRGEGANQFFGTSACGVGDYDGDGYGDLLVGAYAFPPGGKVYVYGGNSAGASASPIATFQSAQASAAFGNCVAPAGDVNGDGKSDLLVGSVFWDPNGSIPDAGAAFVFLGGSPSNAVPYATLTGTSALENVGQSVAAGDVNGDGFSDIATGAPRGAMTHTGEGDVRVYPGNSVYPPSPTFGRARPARQTRPELLTQPIATLGRSSRPDAVGLDVFAANPGGRGRVAMDWRVQNTGSALSISGRTGWAPMGSPGGPNAGIPVLAALVTGLHADSVYSRRARILARSPFFRYGPWLNPQSHARGQWDFRTAPSRTDVAIPLAAPAGIELSDAWPNPSHGSVRCEFALPRAGNARVVVRDLAGRRIRTLAEGAWCAGRHALVWNGVDDAGRSCAPGLYFVDATAGDRRATKRLVLVR